MKAHIQTLLKCIALPLLCIVLSWFLCRSHITDFQYFIEPPLSPLPKTTLLFWTVLAVTAGIASWLVHQAHISRNCRFEALFLYYLQLGLLLFWSVFFYRFHFFFFAFIWLLFQWTILWMTIQSFYALRKSAGILLVPSLLWVSFCGYLNLLLSLMN